MLEGALLTFKAYHGSIPGDYGREREVGSLGDQYLLECSPQNNAVLRTLLPEPQMLLVPSVEPGQRPEGRCKGHVKFFNPPVSHVSVAQKLCGRVAVHSYPSVCSGSGWCVPSCIFLSFLALPRSCCPWVDGSAVEAHVLLSRKSLPVSLSFVKIWNVEGLLNATEHQGAHCCECRALCLFNLSRPVCWATSEKGGRDTGNPQSV